MDLSNCAKNKTITDIKNNIKTYINTDIKTHINNDIKTETKPHIKNCIKVEKIDDQKGNDCSKGATKTRHPTCALCANHGVILAVRGHKRKCPKRDCKCDLCKLTAEKRKLMATTIREKRKLKEDSADINLTDAEVFGPPVIKKEKIDGTSDTNNDIDYKSDDEDSCKSEQSVSNINDNEMNEFIDKIWDSLPVETRFKSILCYYLAETGCKNSLETNIDLILQAYSTVAQSSHSLPVRPNSNLNAVFESKVGPFTYPSTFIGNPYPYGLLNYSLIDPRISHLYR
ncbi:unnamed protein product [Oppiella nova]|uniref:DM domain-containing protein n=1 Tax=Oppiella nova TaxID=334625 RepID=A0A7R9MGI5_9ACAR|nr:unnamed protein product [Oppiella nova]CAG2176926.1 unnamed protein product [Oppiella nova]